MRARVIVTLKPGVLDPQGKAIEGALGALGFAEVKGVRAGKVIDLELATADRTKAEAEVRAMCERLLANTVIETYAVEWGEEPAAPGGRLREGEALSPAEGR